jgi:dTDP-4-amino-4,6-dideoxygalactose transaminase
MTNPIRQIPMSSPDLGEAERQAVSAVLNTPSLSMGQEITKFEQAFCEFTGARHAIGVNSGTAGLHLCVRAADVQAGDFVITTPFSFIASSNVILFEKAVPIFVDVDPLTGNIDPHLVEQAANDIVEGNAAARHWLPRRGAPQNGHLKALLPVDVFGQPADLDSINGTARKYGLKVIEDSCEAIGAAYKGRSVGTLGNYGVFAFYPNKQITTGEGGMIITDDDDAAALMRALRNQGRAPGDTWLQHTHMGYNYRLDEMSAALGRVQMQRLDELIAQREQVSTWYADRLAEIPGIEIPFVAPYTSRVSWFVYVIRLQGGDYRNEFSRKLLEKGIPSRPYFAPIHLQPFMVSQFGYQPGDFPVTEDLGQRSLALPFSGVMTEDEVDYVCQVVRDTMKRK